MSLLSPTPLFLWLPFDMEFSEVMPLDELSDLISVESTPDLAPSPPISPLSSPLPFSFLH